MIHLRNQKFIDFTVITSFLLVTTSSVLSQLYEDDVCKTQNNTQWTCKRIQDCESVFLTIREKRPEICGFSGFTSFVCCEPTLSLGPTTITPIEKTSTATPLPSRAPPHSNVQSKSELKCKEYAKYVYEEPEQTVLALDEEPELENKCGVPITPLIVDGDPTAPREFPHQVNIGFHRNNRIYWLCTGSLISENFVLSAAHCSRSNYYGRPRVAVIGDLDISRNDEDADPEQINIVEIFDHPDYVKGYNDVALYRLERNVTFNSYRRPACLNTKTAIPNKAIATGWGDTSYKGIRSTHLMKVQLDVIPHKKCSKYWPVGITLTTGLHEEAVVCAGDLVGKKDTCQGDSGGPLQVLLDEPYCMYSIIGVTSFGKMCGVQTPGVYTRVSHFVPWIESIVWP